MVRKPKEQERLEDEAAIMERMNEALKRALSTPHQTQKEMVERRRQDAIKPRKK